MTSACKIARVFLLSNQMKFITYLSFYTTSTTTRMNSEVYSRRSTLCQGENSPANSERFFIFSNFASAGAYSIPGGFNPIRRAHDHQITFHNKFPMLSFLSQRSYP